MLRFARRTQQNALLTSTEFEGSFAATRKTRVTPARYALGGILRIGPARTVVTHAQNRSTDFP
jgi:hypothetical protein